MHNKNKELKNYAKSKGVYLYELAEGLGMTDSTLFRHLRHEFSDEKLAKAKAVIDRIAESRVE